MGGREGWGVGDGDREVKRREGERRGRELQLQRRQVRCGGPPDGRGTVISGESASRGTQ